MSSNCSLKPAPDTCLFIIEDEGLVFSEQQQTIYKLNTAATYIWCLLEELKSAEAEGVIQQYQKAFQLSPDEAKSQFSSITEQWNNAGLLEGSGNVCLQKKNQYEHQVSKSKNIPDFISSDIYKTYTYTLLSTNIKVNYSSEEQFKWVHPVIGHLEISNAEKVDTRLDIIVLENTIHIYRDKEWIASVADASSLAPQIKALILQAAINKQRYFIYVHGAVIRKDNYCILLPGTSGSGKSTLAAALIKSGFQYMSDEIALLEKLKKREERLCK